MVFNATILRIDSFSAPDPGGLKVVNGGNALSCRCCLGAPTVQDHYSGFGLEEEGSVMLRAMSRDLGPALTRAGYPAGFALAAEQRISVEPDKAEGPLDYRVRNVISQPHGAGSVVVAELRMD